MSTESPQKTIARVPQSGKKLSWSLINFFLDLCLLLNFVVVLFIAATLQFVFPVGVKAHGWKLWGGDVVAWQNLEFTTLAIFTLGVTVHVMLHWSWICGVLNKQLFKRTVLKSDGTDTLIGVVLIAALVHVIAIGLLLARWSIEKPLS